MKPATTDFFYRASKTKDGFQARCIECDKERARVLWPSRAAAAGMVDKDAAAIFARSTEHARREAARVHRTKSPDRYRGVSGGPLLAGYVAR